MSARAQAEAGAALDELDPVDGARRVEPVTGRRPGWGRQQPGPFVVADRVGTDADLVGQLCDAVPAPGDRGGGHGSTVNL
jgi:hypothetical protein